jgi:uncharacterized protein
MSLNVEPITVLSDDESWYLLASMTLGRLVTSAVGQPEIFPVNYVVQRPTVLFRTAEGTKLLSAVLNDRVALEADEHNVEEGWSVIVKGRAQVLSSAAELEKADRAQLLPWTPTVKLRYVRIVATEITGRRFRFGTEPDHTSCRIDDAGG